MADNIGQLFIDLLPDVDKKKFQAAVDASTKTVNAKINVELKATQSAVRKAVNDVNRRLKTSKANMPKIDVGLKVSQRSVRSAIREANAHIKAAKTAMPTLNVKLNLTDEQLKLAREIHTDVAQIQTVVNRKPIKLDVELDEKAQASLLSKIQLLQERARLKASADSIKFARADELVRTRSALRIEEMEKRASLARSSRSSNSLRILRNDLSNFEFTTTRTLRRLGFGFSLLTGAVVGSFAAISAAALKSFADTEIQVQRTAAVLGTDAFQRAAADGKDAWAAFNDEIKNTAPQLQSAINQTALATIFDPTEIASGTRALAQAGLQIGDIQSSLESVAKFAQNEEILPEEAVQNLVQGATAAGESLSDIERLADRFTIVANDTTATATEVAEAFANRAAPAFRAYGESVDSTLTVLDLFARAGIKGKTAGEQVGILIREINKASQKTPETTAAFKKYGIEIGKVNGKQVPFLKTLGQLGTLLDNVRKTKGSQGLAAIRKELGLTEKSGAGLIQIMSQVSSLGVKGLFDLERQINRSNGALQRQSDIIANTLAFQFDRFTNQIGLLFKTAAGPTGKAFTGVLKEFNDQMEAGTGSAGRLSGRIEQIGESIRSKVEPILKSVFFGRQGPDFFSGLAAMYSKTLSALSKGFIAFRVAAFGPNDDRGFFTVLGDGLEAFGDLALRLFPRIGAGIGAITKFVMNNRGQAEGLAKTWLSVFAASKTLSLFVIPAIDGLEKLAKAGKFFVGLSLAKSVSDTASSMSRLASSTVDAAAAQAALNNSMIIFGKRRAAVQGSSGVAAASAGAAGISGAKVSAASAAATKLRLALKPLLKTLGLIGLAAELAAGAASGLFDELSKINNKYSEVGRSLRELKPVTDAISSTVSTSFSVLKDVLGIVVRVGESFGRVVGSMISDVIILAADFKRIFTADSIVESLKAMSDTIANTILNTIMLPLKVGISFAIDVLADALESLKNIPGIGDTVNKAVGGLRSAADATRNFRLNLSEAEAPANKLSGSLKVVSSAMRDSKNASDSLMKKFGVMGVYVDGSTSRFRNLNEVLRIVAARSKNGAAYQKVLAEAVSDVDTNMANLAGGKNNIQKMLDSVAIGSKKAADKLIELKQASIILARDVKIEESKQFYSNLSSAAPELAGVFKDQFSASSKNIRSVADKELKSYKKMLSGILSGPSSGIGGGGASIIGDQKDLGNQKGLEDVKTAAELAAEAISKLTQKQLDAKAASLIPKVIKSSAQGYKATALEAEVLKRVLPSLEDQLKKQTDAVSKLDKALQDLQATQLKGTKKFTDEAFALDQSVKQLQLQRLDLIIAGTPEEDTAIKALDEQIAKLQQQAERSNLVQSLQLDPLKKKLEETFNPVVELGFDQIVKRFEEINAKKAPLEKAIAGGENLKALLEATIKDAEYKFTDAGANVSLGLIKGVQSKTVQVTASGKQSGDALLTGLNSVMNFGSPSKTMITRGQWAAEGFAQGVNANNAMVMQAGVSTMFSFLTGMRNVYENRVQPFVTGIAKWIKDNKGPVSYDRTLLRPAGSAMMEGFQKGLSDGFSEVKSWVKSVGPDLAKHTIPDSIFKEMSAEFLIGNASADLAFNPDKFFESINPLTGFLGYGFGGLGQSTGLQDTINQAKIIAQMFGIVPNIGSELRRYNNPGYNAAIGGAAGSLHVAGRAMDFTGPEGNLDAASAWAKKLLGKSFAEVLWRTTGHYDHLHIGWIYGIEKLMADIAGASRTVEDALSQAANKTGVDFNFLAAIAKAESGFNPFAGSPAGARGLMQLMPATASGLGVKNILDPYQNALGGAKYIKNMLDMFGGNKSLALAGYNAGPGNARIALTSFGETMAYVERVLRYFKNFSTGNYRAQGGKVNANTPYMVGERGMEMFIPQQNGSVISNKDIRDLILSMKGNSSAGSSSTVNDNRTINVHSNATDPATVASIINSHMGMQIRGVHR